MKQPPGNKPPSQYRALFSVKKHKEILQMRCMKSFFEMGMSIIVLAAMAVAASAADPGIAPSRNIQDNRRVIDGGRQPGSILVFNLYTSNGANPGLSDTIFTITNTNTSAPAMLHLFFIDAGGTVADYISCAAAGQTLEFRASEIDPSVTGYLMVVARDAATGLPVSFNHLVGSEQVRMASGHSAVLPAESFQALFSGKFPGSETRSPVVEIRFDGAMYSTVPSEMAADQLRSPADGYSTLVVVNSLRGNLTSTMSAVGAINGALFGEDGKGPEFTARLGGQTVQVLGDKFPPTTPKFGDFLPKGRAGWMRISSSGGVGITGAVISLNPDTSGRAINGGHNMYHLRQTVSTMTYPVFQYSCN